MKRREASIAAMAAFREVHLLRRRPHGTLLGCGVRSHDGERAAETAAEGGEVQRAVDLVEQGGGDSLPVVEGADSRVRLARI